MKLPETARAIPEYEGYYATPHGEIWSTRARKGRDIKRLNHRLDWRGYHNVTLMSAQSPNKWGVRVRKVHQLVLETFIGPKPSKKHGTRHLDGDKNNNALCNLAWATHQENTDDRARLDENPIGERNGMARLTNKEILVIKKLRKMGVKHKRIGEIFGISEKHSGEICNGRRWSAICP